MPDSKHRRASRLSGFYKLVQDQRLETLIAKGFLDLEGATLLRRTGVALKKETAENMIENVVGVFELPIGLGLNFVVNGRDYVVPMVVEEPSIVAAVSHAAAIVREAGGFFCEADRSIVTGQIQLVDVPDPQAALAALEAAKDELLAAADAIEPNMKARGGGALDLDARWLAAPAGATPEQARRLEMLVVHVYVDACDAMGANLINTIAEGLAPEVERVTGGRVFLRILSNLSDRRRVKARCAIPTHLLEWQGFSGDAVAEGVVRASGFAEADPYRAATHNKGIMNGIDALAIATGQDWRAIEAGAHAFAARNGRYGPLAKWRLRESHLVGELDMPLAVGTVGGTISVHPTVKLLLKLLDIHNAAELACVMGAVGLAQNLAAIKALGSVGIQKGHMALHARSVAVVAGAAPDELDELTRRLVEDGDIKVHRAKVLLQALRDQRNATKEGATP